MLNYHREPPYEFDSHDEYDPGEWEPEPPLVEEPSYITEERAAALPSLLEN